MIDQWPWIVVAVGILGLLGLYLSSTAGRLDRLHHRIDTARVSLDSQLLRRSAVTAQVASSGLLDPASSLVLSEAAIDARTVDPDDDDARGLVESEFSRVLCVAFPDREEVAELRTDPDTGELVDELAATTRRVEMSRRFLNDAVSSARLLRRQRMVRLFHLAGHTPWPTNFEMDDTPPPGFSDR